MRRLALGLFVALCLGAGVASATVPDPCQLPAASSANSFGHVETPRPGDTIYGVVAVSGWNLDINAISSINLCVDDIFVATADINIPRADVLNVFPTYANSPTAQPGFITSFFTKTQTNSGNCFVYSNGAHTISVKVVESSNPNVSIDIADIPVTVDNTQNQSPFGFIDIPDPNPAVTEGFDSAHPVVGWAIDDGAIDHIDILVDGQVVAGAVCCNVISPPSGSQSSAGTALYGSTRPDVQAAFPCVPDSLFSGWAANIDTTQFINGLHVITVRVTDDDGASRVIGSRTVQTDNASLNLHPFGDIDFPEDELTFTPICCAQCGFPSPLPQEVCASRAFNIVNGWVLDTGSRLDFGQTGYVELLIDGVVIANTRRDCVEGPTGAFENCYGVNRPDVEANYPGFVNSDNAGFVFDFLAIDDTLGHLSIQIPTPDGCTKEVVEIAPGKHDVTVLAGDVAETLTTQIGIPLSANFVTCEPLNADLPFGFIDTPYDFQFVSGIVNVVGWAFDADHDLTGIQVDIDGTVVGNAVFPFSRPDVPKNDARVNSANVGWYFLLDTTKLSDSPHDINVYVLEPNDVDGPASRTLIGRRKIVVNNNNPTKSPGL